MSRGRRRIVKDQAAFDRDVEQRERQKRVRDERVAQKLVARQRQIVRKGNR